MNIEVLIGDDTLIKKFDNFIKLINFSNEPQNKDFELCKDSAEHLNKLFKLILKIIT